MQTLGTQAETDLSRPFNALLLEDDQQRADALLALLVRLAAADVRVIRMGGGTRRPRETLEQILTQAAGSDAEAFSVENARLIVRAIVKRQGHEKGVVLLIKQAETVHPTMLRALQAMAPFFVQDGEPTLQVTFVGRPTFLAVLNEPDLTPLRQALGYQGSPQALKQKAADILVEPTAVRPHVLSKSSRANDLPERVEAARVSSASQPSKAPDGISSELAPRAPAPRLKATGSSRVTDGLGRREPTLEQRPVPVAEPSAAEPAVASAYTRRRRRVPLRLMLMLAAVVIAAEAAYFGLHLLFYRDVPARSVVSMVSPAAPPPALPSPPPASSIPAPSTPAPPVAEAPPPSPARNAAPHGTATPSVTSATPLSAEPSTQLRQDFDAFLASSGRNVAALSEAQRGALFTEYLEWRSQNAPASKAPGAKPSRRIVIHVPAGSETAEALSAHLLESSPPEFSTVETRRVATTPDRPSIRYFHPEDEPAAQLTAKWMANTGLNWTLQDFSTFRPLPSRGTIEIWLTKQP